MWEELLQEVHSWQPDTSLEVPGFLQFLWWPDMCLYRRLLCKQMPTCGKPKGPLSRQRQHHFFQDPLCILQMSEQNRPILHMLLPRNPRNAYCYALSSTCRVFSISGPCTMECLRCSAGSINRVDCSDVRDSKFFLKAAFAAMLAAFAAVEICSFLSAFNMSAAFSVHAGMTWHR